jgi:predicted Zn-dependent protease
MQRKGDPQGAQAAVDGGLKAVPDHANLLWAKATILEETGDIDGAIAIYETLYERSPGAVIIANNLASLLATYRDDDASIERAWTIARRLRDAQNPALQDTYGWIAYRRGNPDEALPYLEAAAKGLPSDPIVQAHLGMVLAALDRKGDALAQLQRAVVTAGPADTRTQIEDARALIKTLRETTTD